MKKLQDHALIALIKEHDPLPTKVRKSAFKLAAIESLVMKELYEKQNIRPPKRLRLERLWQRGVWSLRQGFYYLASPWLLVSALMIALFIQDWKTPNQEDLATKELLDRAAQEAPEVLESFLSRENAMHGFFLDDDQVFKQNFRKEQNL